MKIPSGSRPLPSSPRDKLPMPWPESLKSNGAHHSTDARKLRPGLWSGGKRQNTTERSTGFPFRRESRKGLILRGVCQNPARQFWNGLAPNLRRARDPQVAIGLSGSDIPACPDPVRSDGTPEFPGGSGCAPKDPAGGAGADSYTRIGDLEAVGALCALDLG